MVRTARGKLVYEEEPLSPDSPLCNLEHVTITAHSANSTREMDIGRRGFALRELRGYTASGALTGELTRERIANMSDD